MGLFFERTLGPTNPAKPAIRAALEMTIDDPNARDAMAGDLAGGVSSDAGTVAAKPKSLILGVIFVASLVALAWILAAIVDPQLVAEAQKQATTPNYQPADLRLVQLTDVVRNLLATAAGALSGLIVGDAVGTATSGAK
jgi:hypothetical protein